MRLQLAYLLSVTSFYGVLLCYALAPYVLVAMVGANAWQWHLMALTILALISLALFFMVTVNTSALRRWKATTILNASLISIPLYFLWLVF